MRWRARCGTTSPRRALRGRARGAMPPAATPVVSSEHAAQNVADAPGVGTAPRAHTHAAARGRSQGPPPASSRRSASRSASASASSQATTSAGSRLRGRGRTGGRAPDRSRPRRRDRAPPGAGFPSTGAPNTVPSSNNLASVLPRTTFVPSAARRPGKRGRFATRILRCESGFSNLPRRRRAGKPDEAISPRRDQRQRERLATAPRRRARRRRAGARAAARVEPTDGRAGRGHVRSMLLIPCRRPTSSTMWIFARVRSGRARRRLRRRVGRRCPFPRRCRAAGGDHFTASECERGAEDRVDPRAVRTEIRRCARSGSGYRSMTPGRARRSTTSPRATRSRPRRHPRAPFGSMPAFEPAALASERRFQALRRTRRSPTARSTPTRAGSARRCRRPRSPGRP